MRLIPRFILVISISLLVTFGLFALSAYLTGRGILDRFDAHQSAEISEIVEGQIRTSMLRGNPEHLRAIIDGLNSAPSVTAAMLIRQNGSIVHMTHETDSISLPIDRIRESLRTEGDHSLILEDGGTEYLVVTVPVDRLTACTECHGNAAEPIAYLTVQTTRHSFGEITRGHRNANILLTGIVFVVVATIVSLTVLFVVVRPLNRFTRELDERADAVRADPDHQDLEPVRYLGSDSQEITHMVARFNELSDQLNAAKHEIEESHRRQMEAAQNLGYIGEMAAHTAHEIKNPLAGIRGSLSTISSKMPSSNPHRQIIERAIVELERIYQSMMDLLTTVKGGPPAFARVDANVVISNIAHLLNKERREKRVRIVLKLEPKLPPIEADRNLLSQIVWNLLANAVEAVASEGRVTVSTRMGGTSGDQVLIIVSDDGPGIREADLESIFKPFVTGRKEGTGLGLSVVKRAVAVHAGEVQVRSTVGKGATFTVSLPVRASANVIEEHES